MINWFGKQEENEDDEQFDIGLQMGFLAAETRAIRIIREFDMPEEYKAQLIEQIENGEDEHHDE
jgi:hypothetical protein